MSSAHPSSDIAEGEAAVAPQNILHLPSVRALCVQLVAAAVPVVAAIAWVALGMPALPLIVWALVQGVIATTLAYLLVMDRWWLWIHLLFAPALVLVALTGLPPWLFLTGFFLLFLVHGATYRTQVPTHLSRREAIAAVVKLLPSQPGFSCIDLGCGFGGVLGALARSRRDGKYCGIEAALLPFVASWIRGRIDGYPTRWGNLWDVDLAGYDVVYAYLSPAAMPRLWEKAQREMRPDAVLISNNFLIPGASPELTINVDKRKDAVVYLWRIGDSQC